MGTYSNQDYRTPEQAPKKGNIDPLFLAAGARKSVVGNAAGIVFDTILPERSHAIPSNQFVYGITGAMPGYAQQQNRPLIDTAQKPTGFVSQPKEKETAVNPASVLFGGNLLQKEDNLQPLNYLNDMAEDIVPDRIIQVGNAAVQSEGLSNVQ